MTDQPTFELVDVDDDFIPSHCCVCGREIEVAREDEFADMACSWTCAYTLMARNASITKH